MLYQRPPSRRSYQSSDNLSNAIGQKPNLDGKKTSPGRERASRKVRRNKRTTKNSKSPSRSESDSDANVSCHSEGSRVSFDPVPSDTEVNNLGMDVQLLVWRMEKIVAGTVF